MTAASNSEASEYAIENGWLCEVAKVHTCGTDPGGYFGAHEPGCGLIPVARIDDLLAAHAAQATQTPASQPIPAPVDSGAIGRPIGPQNADEGVGTGAGEGAPRQDTASAWVTRSTDCPEAPAQAHPLAGRLNERQVNELRRLVHTCTYDCAADRCAIDEADYDVADAVADWHAALVREHTDRALAEVEQRIEAAAVATNVDYIEVHGAHVRRHPFAAEHYREAAAIVRAARQERGR